MTFDTVFQKIIKSGIMVYRGNGEEPQYIDTNQVIHKNGYLIFDVNYKIVMKNNGYVQHDVNHKTVKVFVSDANISYDKIQFADFYITPYDYTHLCKKLDGGDYSDWYMGNNTDKYILTQNNTPVVITVTDESVCVEYGQFLTVPAPVWCRAFYKEINREYRKRLEYEKLEGKPYPLKPPIKNETIVSFNTVKEALIAFLNLNSKLERI